VPTKAELAALKASLAEERYLPSAIVDAMRTLPAQTRPMDVLQAMVPMLGAYDPDLADESRAANGRKALRLIARFPLIVSAWYRLRQGLDIVRPSPDLNHAANFLYTMHGVKPDPETARDMDVILVVHAEHSFNASTFACRQVASTQAHIYASIGAALGALSGDLHGGANEEVRRMFEIIGAKENARDYVIKTLDAGGKIMGMGHAVYKTVDPRARFLQPMARRLAEQTGDFRWFEINEEVAQVTAEEFKRRKNIAIYPNVDFYAATVYSLMGIPTDLFTPIFAVARVAGYAAHFMEERFAEAQPKPALYRPGAEYVGRYCGEEGCEFVPLDERG
jgi:citrate synthase